MWFSKMWINRSIQNRLTKKNLFSKFQNNNFWARKSIFKLASPFPIWNSWKISMYRQFRRTDAKIHLISKSSYYNILSQRHIWTPVARVFSLLRSVAPNGCIAYFGGNLVRKRINGHYVPWKVSEILFKINADWFKWKL